MSDYRCKQHPTLRVLVFTDGSVMVPKSGTHPAHLTKGTKHPEGYMYVTIKRKRYAVHRLVVETFIGEIPADREVDHINHKRDDNRVKNLRIVTDSENARNRADVDKVTADGRTHLWEDRLKQKRECQRLYRARKKTQENNER